MRTGGLLDVTNPNLLGGQIDIAAPLGIGAGETIISKTTPLLKLGAKREGDPELVTIAVSALALDNPGAVSQILLQGVLKFGVGTAQFGSQQQTAVTVPTLTAEIIFDIQMGTQITVPASFIQLDIRYTSVMLGGFAAGQSGGPTQRVIAGLGYGDKRTTSPITKTDPLVNLGALALTTFAKPPFAKEARITWREYSTVGPLGVRFMTPSASIQQLTAVPVPAPISPPLFPWPTNCSRLDVLNNDAANIMNFLTVVHTLDL